MAQQAIPNDWDEVSWCCVVVEWPSSIEWMTILNGLLSNPTQGRYWDASTGVIVAAQVVGNEIVNRNCIFDINS